MYNENRAIEYYIVERPDEAWPYSYSAKALEAEFRELAANQKLQGVFISLDGYLEALHNSRNIIDLSYMGGATLLVFEKTVIEFAIHVEGMINYHVFPRWEMKTKRITDCPPDDMCRSDKYFFDISHHDITYEFVNHTVKNITVKGTDTWGFSLESFDYDKAEIAAQSNDLPTEIDISLDNDTLIRFVGDGIEYYWIILSEYE